MTIYHQAENAHTLEVDIRPSGKLETSFFRSSPADIALSCTYIKSGWQEIQNYADDVCKPDLHDYIENQAQETFSPLISAAQTAAQAAADSAETCADLVDALDIDTLISGEAAARAQADAALQLSLETEIGELETALSAKAAADMVYNKTEMTSLLAAKADLNSPAFSGTPTVPTAGTGASAMQAANLELVEQKLAAVMGANGLYVSTTVSGAQWSREWFSDAQKTQRVWLEQGGYLASVTSSVTQNTVTYLKPFTNTSYHVCRELDHTYSGTLKNCNIWIGMSNKTTTGFKYKTDNTYVDSSSWYACGK